MARPRKSEAVSDPEDIKIRLAVLEATTKLRFKAIKRARKIAAMEVERRLVALNGEASRLATILAETLPREVGEAKFEQIKKDISLLQLSGSESGGRRTILTPIVGVILQIAIGILLALVAFLLAR